MEALVQKIAEQTLGQTPVLVEEIKGKGKNNLVFKITIPNNQVILRLSNREGTLELYKKEAWCAEAAKSKGIPTPIIIRTGFVDGYAYSIQEFVEGTSGTDVPEKVGEIWFALGQHARILHEIEAVDLKIDYKKMISSFFVDDYFVSRNIFSKELSLAVKNRLEETFAWEFSPKLCHGNLHPSNVIVGADNRFHLIDWETATGNRTPHAELAEIYTWNTGKENISYFLNGYGIETGEVSKMMRDIQTLVLLRLVQVIIRKMPKDDDWKQDMYIKETVTRLLGIENYSQDILFTKNL